jgi:hypothetical protein
MPNDKNFLDLVSYLRTAHLRPNSECTDRVGALYTQRLSDQMRRASEKQSEPDK